MKKYIYKHPIWFIAVIITTILSAMADVYFAFIIKRVVDASAFSHNNLFIKEVFFALFFLGIAFVLSILRKVVESYYIKITMVELRMDVFSGILARNISSFKEENTANYISSLTNDMTIIEQDYLLNILEIIDNIFIFILSISSLAILSYQVSVGVVILGALPLLFPFIFGKILSHKKLNYSLELSHFTQKIKDIFSGYEVIKSFHIQDKTLEEFKLHNKSLEQKKYTFRVLSTAVEIAGGTSGQLMHLVAITIGAYIVSTGKLSFGDLLAILQLMTFVVNPIVQISNRTNKIKSSEGIMFKLNHYAIKDQANIQNRMKLSFNHSITIENLNFSYNDKVILSDINLQLYKGKKYAIIGSSGSGKSTLLKILLNYYTNYDGKVMIDDHDYKYLSDNDLYRLISIIQQDVFMFDDTIYNNIDLFQNYESSHVLKAMIQAQLTDLLNSKSDREEFEVGENGACLSGGEKQRVSIARAIIKDTPILGIDEGTSALDFNTATEIENILLTIEDKTLLMVTHKLDKSLLSQFDEVILLDRGSVVHKCTYNELKNKEEYLLLIKENKTSHK